MKHKNFLKHLKLTLVIIFIIYQLGTLYVDYYNNIHDIGDYAITQADIINNMIDVEDYKLLIKTKTKDVKYYKIQQILKKEALTIGAEYIYVERYLGKKTIEYIYDSSDDSFGDKEVISNIERYNKKYSFSDGMESSNLWGNLLTGYSPIIDNGKIIGLVGVDYSKTYIDNIFSKYTHKIYINFLVLLFFIIANAFIVKKEKKNDEQNIASFYEKVVRTLATSISKKSDCTWEHSDRVSLFTVKIGENLGFNAKQVETLKWAALLHDVGKIGIPGNILEKPGKLTSAEYLTIQTHPLHSADILKNIFEKDESVADSQMYENIIDVALHHHERWDGHGYPHKLKGLDISIYSRIVSVADAYEAMTAIRPYKPAMDKETAIQELVKNKNKQFDGEIVDIFVSILRNTTEY